MPQPIELVGKRALVVVDEAADHMIDGQELAGEVVCLWPKEGLFALGGVIVRLDESVPAKYRHHQISAMPRYHGESLDSALDGKEVIVNISLIHPDGREVRGIGSFSIIR